MKPMCCGGRKLFRINRLAPAMLLATVFAGSYAAVSQAENEATVTPMQGVPPTRESQVTMAN